MKAMVLNEYGSSAKFSQQVVAKPQIKEGHVTAVPLS